MNDIPQGLTLEESMKQVMKTLPPFIRSYLSEGKYTAVAQGLMAKYNLRLDQGGVLERELVLLLMGIENPDEFTKSLIDEAKIVDKMTVNNIVRDINDQIFVPLRREEENMGKVDVFQQPKPPVPPTPPVRPVTPAPQSRPVVAPAPHIAPLPPKTVMPALGGTLKDAVRAALASKPADASKLLLADHEEPHIASPAPRTVENITPQAEVTVAPLPQQSPAAPMPPHPQAPVPVQMPAPVIEAPVAPRAPMPAAPMVPPVNKTPPPPPLTSYSADPYREPIDEK